ncbi:MAG: tRNA (adenosine(37)-N6)-threonylcarbamoyltransferase complex dimerization subunit type 1 TsaB [Solirubrobacterales bacterium]|nr:tRNA (adenosine(37)-N6)-threonylcarbamoyltransferase complex dimerization subunit type 1 TsaB [Solirubrobacterales bacterium]
MRIVGFDTATDDTVVAAMDGDRLVFEESVPPADRRPVHSQALLDLSGRAAEALGGWDEVERIAVGVGPGTFTGIRIGIATAAGLATTTGIPAVGVSTLTALAHSIASRAEAERLMPLVDARRGEVFGCLHDGAGEPLEEPFVCGPEELAERLREGALGGAAPLAAGPGAVRFRDELLRAGFETEPDGSPVHRLDGRPFCELGAAADPVGPETLKPLYLRIPDAQLWLERDGKNGRRTDGPQGG